MAATFLEPGVDGKEEMPILQSKLSKQWLPVSVIIEYILPLLDRVSRNVLCSTYKELYAASHKVNDTPWPLKRRLHDGGHEDVYVVTYSPDSELLASGDDDGMIRIWDRADGRCALLGGHLGTVNDLSFSSDGNLLASASADESIRLWKLQDQSFRVLEGHGSGVLTVAFSGDGSTLVSGDCLGEIRLWNVNDGRCVRELVDESLVGIFSLSFAPDGETIATAGVRENQDGEEHGALFLWDISDADDSSATTTIVEIHDGIVHSLEYSPDGRYFASGAENGTVRLWNTDGSCAIVMTGNIGDPVFSVAFSPNGKMMASASSDGSVRLWSIEDGDGNCLVTLLGHHESDALSVAFSPDGQMLASGGRDGAVRLWNPHEQDRELFKQVDWDLIFRLWNFRKE
jgi:WD40 repeat protein